ncbi:hypothetical protein ACFQXA_08750 [Nocardiopsis composta]
MRVPNRPDQRDVVRPRTTAEAVHRLVSRLTPATGASCAPSTATAP